jgi:hypothetical protein
MTLTEFQDDHLSQYEMATFCNLNNSMNSERSVAAAEMPRSSAVGTCPSYADIMAYQHNLYLNSIYRNQFLLPTGFSSLANAEHSCQNSLKRFKMYELEHLDHANVHSGNFSNSSNLTDHCNSDDENGNL